MDFGGDRWIARCTQRLLIALQGFPGGALLSFAMGKDTGAVLGSHVVTLTHPLCRVVRLPECLQQFPVAHHCGIEYHAHHFRMAGAARAHFFIGGMGRITAGVTRGGHVHAGQQPEFALRTPETAQSEHRCLHVGGKRWFERMTVDVMPLRHRHRDIAPRQGLRRGYHADFPGMAEHITNPDE